MTPIEWLENRAPGFIELSIDERNAMMQFALMWSFFEDQALGRRGSTNNLVAFVIRLQELRRLNPQPFEAALEYFRARYFLHGQPTHHFYGLLLRNNDRPEMVAAVLSNQNNDAVDCVSACLIIAYRFRNNLMHGEKWAYAIKDQQSNFEHGSEVLMAALNQHLGNP